MTTRPCTAQGCDRPTIARGLCRSHYNREWKKGEYSQKPSEERFWANVDKSSDCWIWTASTTRGYGTLSVNGKHMYAHRYSFELHKGEIPPDMVIDHLCFTPACVNPYHLQTVTVQANIENRSGPNSNNSSGYRGVARSRNRWSARASKGGKNYYAGVYDTAEDAAQAAQDLRRELFANSTLDRRSP